MIKVASLVVSLLIVANAFEVVNEDTNEVIYSKSDIVEDTEQEPDTEPHVDHQVIDNSDEGGQDINDEDQDLYKWHETLAEDDDELVEDLSDPIIQDPNADMHELGDVDKNGDPIEELLIEDDQEIVRQEFMSNSNGIQNDKVSDVVEEFDDDQGNHVRKETITGPGFQSVRYSSAPGSDSSQRSSNPPDGQVIEAMMQDMVKQMFGGPSPVMHDLIKQKSGSVKDTDKQNQSKNSQSATVVRRPPGQEIETNIDDENDDDTSLEVYHEDNSEDVIRQLREQQQKMEQTFLQQLFGQSAFFGKPKARRADIEKNNFSNEQLSLKNDKRFKNYNKEKVNFSSTSNLQAETQSQTLIVLLGTLSVVFMVGLYIYQYNQKVSNNNQSEFQLKKTSYQSQRSQPVEMSEQNLSTIISLDEEDSISHTAVNMSIETEPESTNQFNLSKRSNGIATPSRKQYDRKRL